MKSLKVKRTEATVRNEKWATMTNDDKLNYLNANKLRAEKQRRKLGQTDEQGNTIIPKECVY